MRPENADGKKYRRFALDISSEHAARLPPGERPDQGPLLDVLALKPAKCRFFRFRAITPAGSDWAFG